ncbi:hypothetical protein [Cetobacterium sp.]|uniref:hypothetical protein n=1 Tax=Cetobacterium sp. TaxID=2071632 RepID=UPI002FCA4DE6
MTIKELIEKWQKEIQLSKEKEKTVNKILARVLKLKYEGGNDVSSEKKIEILKEIRKTLQVKRLNENEIKFAQDNNKHLELINIAMVKLEDKKHK